MTFSLRLGEASDLPFLLEHDRHVRPDVLDTVVRRGRTLLVEHEDQRAGWLRWNLFWDEIPFMNMLFVVDDHRRKGMGGALIAAWERRVVEAGFTSVMTSTMADESAQHLFRRHGYVDCGSLLLPGEPTEILFRKELGVARLSQPVG